MRRKSYTSSSPGGHFVVRNRRASSELPLPQLHLVALGLDLGGDCTGSAEGSFSGGGWGAGVVESGLGRGGSQESSNRGCRGGGGEGVHRQGAVATTPLQGVAYQGRKSARDRKSKFGDERRAAHLCKAFHNEKLRVPSKRWKSRFWKTNIRLRN